MTQIDTRGEGGGVQNGPKNKHVFFERPLKLMKLRLYNFEIFTNLRRNFAIVYLLLDN
jgi:hypothetical protein